MRRYWVPDEMIDEVGTVRLRGEVLHHIRDVCRQRLLAKFEILTAGGQAHLVEVIEETKHESVAKILETREIQDLARPHLHLVLSIPRFPVFEAILEKSVELGVRSIIPVFSDFSFIRRQDEVLKKKQPRFAKIVVAATQQSGRGDLLKIEQARDLDDFLKSFNPEGQAQGLFAYEGAGVLTAGESLRALRSRAPPDVFIFVGSEGGFSDREVQLFQTLGFDPVTLGGQVLRVETACVALVSIIKYAFDLMR